MIEIELQNDQNRKRAVKVWSAKRGVEGSLLLLRRLQEAVHRQV
jgi:hypothetical protein